LAGQPERAEGEFQVARELLESSLATNPEDLQKSVNRMPTGTLSAG